MDTTVQDPTINLARERSFALGAVEVRPSTREIVGPRGREILEPRVMQVLVALARAGGEIVTRDDLIASCWDGRIVGEDAINRVLSRLRRHTEGVGRDGWSLETVTKVGYRLLPADHDPNQPRIVTPPPNRRGLLAAGAAAGVVAVGGGFAWRLSRPRVSNEAKALYEKGREALRQGLPEPTAQAVGFLREAVAEAPDYAQAWGTLGRAYQMSLTFTDAPRQPGVKAQAEAAANRALELDPNQAEAVATLALLAPIYRNWAAAEDLCRRALALHPGEPSVELGYNKLLLSVGRMQAALKAAEAAVAGDPYAPYNHFGLAMSLWGLGRSEEAERATRKALALWPRHLALWFMLFHLLAYRGRGDEALAFAANVGGRPAVLPDQDLELSLSATRALVSGKKDDVDSAVEIQIQGARRGVGLAESAIMWLSALGRLDAAFAVARGLYFDEGFSLGSQRYSPAAGRFALARSRATYPLFLPPTAALRADPRFPGVVRGIGLTDYWKLPGRGPDDSSWARPPA